MDFLKILKALTAAMDLELSDICVMAVLCTYAQFEDNQTIEMSRAEIKAEFPRLSQSTIKRSISRLEENHYIAVIRSGTQKNKYRVLIDIPKGQAQPQIKQKKNPYKHDTETPMNEYYDAILKNPFFNTSGDN